MGEPKFRCEMIEKEDSTDFIIGRVVVTVPHDALREYRREHFLNSFSETLVKVFGEGMVEGAKNVRGLL